MEEQSGEGSDDNHQPSTSGARRGRGRGRTRPRGARGGQARGRGQRGRQSRAGGGSQPRGGAARRGRRGGRRVPGLAPVDAERVAHLQQQRQDNIEESLQRLTANEMRPILETILKEQPGLLFDVWERAFRPPTRQLPPLDTPSWCVCHNCRPMESDLENLCCGLRPQNCVSTSAAFQLVALDPHVLQVANFYRNDLLAAEVGHDMKAKRHAAYRQFTLWRHGRLGAGARRVVPSCVVCKVRQTYPSPTGQYTGFTPYRLG